MGGLAKLAVKGPCWVDDNHPGAMQARSPNTLYSLGLGNAAFKAKNFFNAAFLKLGLKLTNRHFILDRVPGDKHTGRKAAIPLLQPLQQAIKFAGFFKGRIN